MPIFTYFAVVGSVLIALLFVADLTLEKGTPAVVASDHHVLPKPRRPDPIQILSTAPAPAPDMTSPLVLAAQPKAQSASPEVLAKVEPAALAARAEAPPKKRVTRGQPPVDYRQNHTWSRDFGLAGW